jgi:hypothetical protein
MPATVIDVDAKARGVRENGRACHEALKQAKLNRRKLDR